VALPEVKLRRRGASSGAGLEVDERHARCPPVLFGVERPLSCASTTMTPAAAMGVRRVGAELPAVTLVAELVSGPGLFEGIFRPGASIIRKVTVHVRSETTSWFSQAAHPNAARGRATRTRLVRSVKAGEVDTRGAVVAHGEQGLTGSAVLARRSRGGAPRAGPPNFRRARPRFSSPHPLRAGGTRARSPMSLGLRSW